MGDAAAGLASDTGRALVVFAQWTILGFVVDVGLDGATDWRKGTVVWLAVSTFAINAYGLLKSYAALGERGLRPENQETIFGLFMEVITLMQAFGIAWCCARLFSLEKLTTYGKPFHEQTFLAQLGNSIFEMSLVQAGVGWAATPPTTMAEKTVAWLAATVGGILVVNLFLVSVVLGRRGWWQQV